MLRECLWPQGEEGCTDGLRIPVAEVRIGKAVEVGGLRPSLCVGR